ncbi:alpha-catulin-like isoform X2 [Panonychus citri]|uniref:alpha-catulin-like isoform X2 n=1 Tax=Panonychus citri TaxID=50023 RepID=UPI002307B942|nr:alpha-catulin-like isoform X2 [Panonychus citri]
MLSGGREKLTKSEKTHRALVRIGQSINQSIERFALVGETIGDDNPEIKIDMVDSCKDVRTAGCIFEQLCDLTADSGAYNSRCYSDQRGLFRGARSLLSSVTRVLLIADAVVVNQLLSPKDRTLKDERRRAEMGSARRFIDRSTILLLTSAKACLRHPDCESAKDNRDTVLIEIRKTIDIIHKIIKDGVLPTLIPNSFDSSGHSRRSHARLHGHISRYSSLHSPPPSSSSGSSSSNCLIDNINPIPTTFNAIKQFEELVELSRVTLCKGVYRVRLISAFDYFVELTQHFTDSAYTRHDNREKILLHCDKVKIELNQLIRLGIILDEAGSTNPSEDLEEAIVQTIKAVNEVKYQLRRTALNQADELFKLTDELSLINHLRNHSISGDTERLNDYFKLYNEHCDHVNEVCRLLHNVSSSETLVIYSKATEIHVNIFSTQILNACLTLSNYPNSRIAKDNLEVFLDFWITLYSDVHQYSKDIRDLSSGLESLSYYNDSTRMTPLTGLSSSSSSTTTTATTTTTTTSSSLQSHNNNNNCLNNNSNHVQWSSSVSPKSVNCSSQVAIQQQQHQHQQQQQQQQQLASLQQQYHQPQQLQQSTSQLTNGPLSSSATLVNGKPRVGSGDKIHITTSELKVISNGVEIDPEKWSTSDDNDVVRRAKAMVGMAISMYQFTFGEGELKTTQDLFTQAEFVAEEANKFYKIVRHFTYQVPSGLAKKDLLDQLDKVPTFVQQLQFTVKQPTVGKAATFTKVDNVIKESKNLMIYVCLSVNSALGCASKYNLDMGAARTRSRTLSPSGRYGDDDGGYEGLSSGMGSKGGTASSDPNI